MFLWRRIYHGSVWLCWACVIMLLFFERVELFELEDFGGRVGRGGGGWPIIQTLLTIEEEGGYTIYKSIYIIALYLFT